MPSETLPAHPATPEGRAERALYFAAVYGHTDSIHGKQWVIDQMVRALTGCPIVTKTGADWQDKPYAYEAQGESDDYRAWRDTSQLDDVDEWDEGIAP